MSPTWWVAAACFVYVGLFVLLRTVQARLRLGAWPVVGQPAGPLRLTRKLVEAVVGAGLMAWTVFMGLYLWNPSWWVALPHVSGGRQVLELAGAVLYLLSAVLITAGNLTLGASWRMGISDEPLPLVRHGIYGALRHPINAGMICYFLAAMALMPNVVTIPAMALAAFAIVCETTLEEDHWLSQDGQRYAALMRETDRFVPVKALLGLVGLAPRRSPPAPDEERPTG